MLSLHVNTFYSQGMLGETHETKSILKWRTSLNLMSYERQNSGTLPFFSSVNGESGKSRDLLSRTSLYREAWFPCSWVNGVSECVGLVSMTEFDCQSVGGCRFSPIRGPSDWDIYLCTALMEPPFLAANANSALTCLDWETKRRSVAELLLSPTWHGLSLKPGQIWLWDI